MTSFEGVFPLNIQPGIKRDGTSFDGNYCVDGKWVRWQRGKPRKIGGYKAIQAGVAGPVRGSFIDSRNGFNYIFAGSASNLEVIVCDNTGAGGGLTDVSPAGFATNANNIWQMDAGFDAGGSSHIIMAHAGQNLAAIDSAVQTPIYYGNPQALTALVTTGTSVSGGVFSLPPYYMGLDNDGYVTWTGPNLPLKFGSTPDGGGTARIAPSKLIKGMRTRGGSGYAPAGLIWSLDQIYRTFFIGGTPIFEFDYIADTALFSTSSVVEYNGRYYWPDFSGTFKIFTGTLDDLPNDMNLNYFFDNVNVLQRQKVWGLKIPRFNEIWWFWPKGSATECTDVLIYNVKMNTWYDTAWASDQSARSSGCSIRTFPYPIMFGLDKNAGSTYTMWEHEYGYDRIDTTGTNAIDSYFETNDISYCAGDGQLSMMTGEDKWVQLDRIEPDFVQSGGMTVTARGQLYANQALTDSAAFPFTSSTNKVDIKTQYRQLRLKFDSNTKGGTYQLGKTLLHMRGGDSRQ